VADARSHLLLAGEPGARKTRLATVVAQAAAERGARVLCGRCWEGGGAPAFCDGYRIWRSCLLRGRRALHHLQLARAGWEELSHHLWWARTMRDIGATHAAAGNCPAAQEAWRAALTVFRQLGTREAGELATWRHRWGCDCG
jgi:hypothetical protein